MDVEIDAGMVTGVTIVLGLIFLYVVVMLAPMFGVVVRALQKAM